MERQFYYHEAANQKWKVRELRRQIKSSLFQRLALSTDKKGILALAHQGHPIRTAEDIIHAPFDIYPRRRNYRPNSTRCSMKLKMDKTATCRKFRQVQLFGFSEQLLGW